MFVTLAWGNGDRRLGWRKVRGTSLLRSCDPQAEVVETALSRVADSQQTYTKVGYHAKLPEAAEVKERKLIALDSA